MELKKLSIAGNTLTGPCGESTLEGLTGLTRLDLSENYFSKATNPPYCHSYSCFFFKFSAIIVIVIMIVSVSSILSLSL